MPSKKQPKKKPRPMDHEKVHRLFDELREELTSCDEVVESNAFTHIDCAINVIFTDTYKKRIRTLQSDIAQLLRLTDKKLRPRFAQMEFYIWVLNNVPHAKEVLPLIDQVTWCPDGLMSEVENHFGNPKTDYHEFD